MLAGHFSYYEIIVGFKGAFLVTILIVASNSPFQTLIINKTNKRTDTQSDVYSETYKSVE